jgi:hypothetical protein
VTEQELLLDCLRRLNGLDLTWYITGSMASNYWGIPRTTHDLDFVIQLPPSAIPRLVEAFRSDFHIDESSIRAAYRPPFQFNAIDLRSALKVDFWFPKSEPFEKEMFARRLKVRFLGESAWIAAPEDVIVHKLIWNRMSPSERQLRDAAGVFAVQGLNLDLHYIRKWADILALREELEKILSGETRPKNT